MRKPTSLSLLGITLMIGGALLVGFYFWERHAAGQAQQQGRQALERSPANPALPPRVLRRGEVLGELAVPRLHLSTIVFEGDDAGILKRGAGHIPATALPEGSGNVGIAAHRDTYFRPLRLIHPKDVVTLRTPGGTLRYSVTSTEIVPPSDVGVLTSAPGRDLTLVTCYPFYYVGSAPKRFIVYASKID